MQHFMQSVPAWHLLHWLLRKKIILQKLIIRMRKIIGVSLGMSLCTKPSSLHVNNAGYEHAIH